jgi:hypothetical protein
VLVLDDPSERNETVVQPVELKEDDEEESHWCVDEKGIHWPLERRWVREKGQVDGQAGSVSYVSSEAFTGDVHIDYVEEDQDLSSEEEL